MKRRLFDTASALSLLLCAATVILWIRANSHEVRVTSLCRGVRYTVQSEGGALALYCPPASNSAKVLQMAAGLRNDQVEWRMDAHRGISFVPWAKPSPVFVPYSAGWRAEQWDDFATTEASGPLLHALEDPDRFIAAHVLLCWWNDFERTWELSYEWNTAEWLSGRGNYDGMFVRLSIPHFLRRPDGTREWTVVYQPHIDPAQFPAIRELWHRRLDRRVAAIPFVNLTAAFLALPGAVLVRRAHRRVRIRRSRSHQICPSCGYDLRATPERCPECGAAVADIARTQT